MTANEKTTKKKTVKKTTAKKKKRKAAAVKKKPGKRGRKPQVNPFTTEKELDRLAKVAGYGLTMEQVAGAFGMSRATFYNLMADHPEIRDRLEQGRASAVKTVAGKLYNKAIKGDLAAIIFFLKSKGGFSERHDFNHSHTGGIEINHKVDIATVQRIEQMSPEQRAQRLTELRAIESRQQDMETVDVQVV